MTLREREDGVFAAVAYDFAGQPIAGVPFEWTAADRSNGKVRNLIVDSTFKSQLAGTFRVQASAGGQQAEATVVVTEEDLAARANPTYWDISSRTGRKRVKTSTEVASSSDEQTSPPAYQDSGSSKIESSPNLPGDGWDDTTWLSADDPGNQTGNPPGSPVDGGAGNGNFQFSAPVVSLPGRGIDLAMNLHYNSRVWNKAGNTLSFDIDYDEPAPGWNLGFGRIVHMGSGGCMMIDADGTRRGYTGSLTSFTSGMSFKGSTTDGGFIDYGCSFNYGNYGSGWSNLANGTSITYSSITAVEGHLHPTKITDAQGNFITITYNNVSGNALINTVTDTLGRVITFHYDSYNRLIEVRGPRMQGQDPIYGTGAVRTLVRIHYKALTLNYSFAYPNNPIVRNGTPWVIDAIYYPATQTGYWFNDADSYSSYGMITKVVEQRGMGWSTGSEAQGVVSPGTMTRQAEYNYPLSTANVAGRTNGAALSDAPTYTELKESWDGMDVAGPAITTYALNNNDWHHDGTSNSPARSVTVTQPTGVISRQYSYRTPGAWTDGLVFFDETVVTNGANPVTVASSLVSWQQGNYTSATSFRARASC